MRSKKQSVNDNLPFFLLQNGHLLSECVHCSHNFSHNENGSVPAAGHVGKEILERLGRKIKIEKQE